jgi:hypothetical protein
MVEAGRTVMDLAATIILIHTALLAVAAIVVMDSSLRITIKSFAERVLHPIPVRLEE